MDGGSLRAPLLGVSPLLSRLSAWGCGNEREGACLPRPPPLPRSPTAKLPGPRGIHPFNPPSCVPVPRPGCQGPSDNPLGRSFLSLPTTRSLLGAPVCVQLNSEHQDPPSTSLPCFWLAPLCSGFRVDLTWRKCIQPAFIIPLSPEHIQGWVSLSPWARTCPHLEKPGLPLHLAEHQGRGPWAPDASGQSRAPPTSGPGCLSGRCLLLSALTRAGRASLPALIYPREVGLPPTSCGDDPSRQRLRHSVHKHSSPISSRHRWRRGPYPHSLCKLGCHVMDRMM